MSRLQRKVCNWCGMPTWRDSAVACQRCGHLLGVARLRWCPCNWCRQSQSPYLCRADNDLQNADFTREESK